MNVSSQPIQAPVELHAEMDLDLDPLTEFVLEIRNFVYSQYKFEPFLPGGQTGETLFR